MSEKKSAYQKIVSHLKPKFSRALDARIAEIESNVITAYTNLVNYQNNPHKTLSEYVALMQSIDKYKRNPLFSSDSLGYYDELSKSTNKQVQASITQLRERLLSQGIDMDAIPTIAASMENFHGWAREIKAYRKNMPTASNTLNQYKSVLDMGKALQDAGNTATNNITIPMKTILESYGISIFDAISFTDPVAEAHLENNRLYESEVNKGMHRAISYLYGISNPQDYEKLYESYGTRATLKRPITKKEDEYMRVYDALHYAVQPTIDQLYNTPLHSLDITRYPNVTDLVNYGVNYCRENPTNN